MATAAAAATGWAGYADWTFCGPLAVDAAGDVLVAGTVPTDSDGAGDADGSEMAVVRFAPDGTPDASFGTGGLATAAFAGAAYASTDAMAVDPASGRVVLGGSAGPSEYADPSDPSNGDESAVAVFAADGTPDPAWASGGADDGSGEMAQVEGGQYPQGGAVTALAFDVAGRLLAAGVSANLGGDSGPTFVLRYDAGGFLDGTFSPGVVWQNTDPYANNYNGGEFRWGSRYAVFTPATVAADATGRIDLVGHDGPLQAGGDIVVMRLLADGRGLDPSYGRGGIADVGPADGYGNGSGSVAVTAAGDLLAVGGTTDGRGGVLLAFAPAPHPRQPVPADRLYAERDANGNVTSLTDAAGVTVERYIYGSYGAVTVENPDGTTRGDGSALFGSAYGWTYLFQDGRLDPATGLYRFGVRDYGPPSGRWEEPDPAGYVNGPNTYQLEISSPVDHVDPSGLFLLAPVSAPAAPPPASTLSTIGDIALGVLESPFVIAGAFVTGVLGSPQSAGGPSWGPTPGPAPLPVPVPVTQTTGGRSGPTTPIGPDKDDNGFVDYDPLDSFKRATGAHGYLTPMFVALHGTTTKLPRGVNLPGKDKCTLPTSRGHLVGSQLGGSNDIKGQITNGTPGNFVLQNPDVNSGPYSQLENGIKFMIIALQTTALVDVYPLYHGSDMAPYEIDYHISTAYGNWTIPFHNDVGYKSN